MWRRSMHACVHVHVFTWLLEVIVVTCHSSLRRTPFSLLDYVANRCRQLLVLASAGLTCTHVFSSGALPSDFAGFAIWVSCPSVGRC